MSGERRGYQGGEKLTATTFAVAFPQVDQVVIVPPLRRLLSIA